MTTARHFHYTRTTEKTDAIAALAALAQESRLDVFRLLVQAGAGGMPAGRIGERLGLPSATLSFHLKPADAPAFVAAQALGAAAATALFAWFAAAEERPAAAAAAQPSLAPPEAQRAGG